MKAIEVVLAAYRSTATTITEEQITAAWTAFETLKAEADRRQEALYLIEAGDFDDDPWGDPDCPLCGGCGVTETAERTGWRPCPRCCVPASSVAELVGPLNGD